MRCRAIANCAWRRAWTTTSPSRSASTSWSRLFSTYRHAREPDMTSPAIDLDRYAELQDTAGADFVAELADTFLQEAPTMLGELRAARSAGDADRFRRAAHSLKSNSQTFGALALGALARDLELIGMSADAARDAARLDALEAEYARAAAALKALRHG